MLWRILVKLINLPIICLLYFGMALCVVPELHGVSVILGLPWDFVEGGLDSLVFGKWMLIMGVPILINGMILERAKQVEIFFTLRMRKRKRFQQWILAACLVAGIIWGVILTIGIWCNLGVNMAVKVSPLLFSNLFMWEVIQIILYFYCQKAAWSGWITFLLNGGGGLLGLYIPLLSRYIPSFWGMLCRSSFGQEQLYEISFYVIMICSNIFVGLLGIAIMTKERSER